MDNITCTNTMVYIFVLKMCHGILIFLSRKIVVINNITLKGWIHCSPHQQLKRKWWLETCQQAAGNIYSTNHYHVFLTPILCSRRVLYYDCVSCPLLVFPFCASNECSVMSVYSATCWSPHNTVLLRIGLLWVCFDSTVIIPSLVAIMIATN